jgi:drug/metabolite transporter (DMT)-like permease
VKFAAQVYSKGNTIFWAIIACLLWSTAYAGIKLGLQYDTPLHFAGLRFMIAGLMLLPFTVRPSSYIRMIREHYRLVLSVMVLQTVMNYSLFYLGMNLIPGALGAVIVGSQPLITAIVAAMMNKEEKLNRSKIITIVFGISGVILISAGRQALRIGTAIEFVGVILILGANIASSVSNVFVSLKSRGINPVVLSSFSLGIGGLILYLASIPIEGTLRVHRPFLYWADLAWLSFMSAFAFSIWFNLLQRPGVKVSELNLWKFIIPVVGAILSWLLVPGEHPEMLTFAGMIIISLSLVLFFVTSGRSRPLSISKK